MMREEEPATMIDCGGGVMLERGERCLLSDGTSLYSDHYYPAALSQGPWPTLLMRQPYGRDIASTVVYAHPAWFARHGYHVVIQDVRGRGDSEGEFYPFRYEGQDGAETIAWLMKHPACNGRIGMYGFSYQGLTQLLAAAEQPPGLLCIAPHMTATDLYHGWFYHQGALRLASTLGWGIQMLREDARRLGLQAASERLEKAWLNVRQQAAEVPYGHHEAIADPQLPGYLRDWIAHRDDNPATQAFWSALDVSTRCEQINVPAFHISGWYDTYLEGSIAGYRALTARAGSPFARENQYLLAGPWIHIPWSDRIGDQNLGEAANYDTDGMLLRWFNHWLKESSEFTDEPKIRYFALGSNRWCTADSWPTECSLTLYARSRGRANSSRGDGLLTLDPPNSAEPSDLFVYDPEVPVFAPGGPLAMSGPYDQSPVEAGNNVLVYTSEPATQEVHIFGQPRVTIYAATSAPCADMTAKLVRITRSGRAEFFSIGIARSSWLFREKTYSADTVQKWEFTLEPTSVVIATGEMLRLEIAGSAFPLYDRNPSTNQAPADADPWNWKRSTQRIVHSAEHASAIHLPVKGAAGW